MVNNNFLPDFVTKTFTDKNGVQTSRTYTFQSYNNLKFLQMVGILILGVIILPLASAVFLFIFVGCVDKKPWVWGILSVIFSGYMLYDYSHGWFFNTFVTDGDRPFAIGLNFASFVLSLFLLFFGKLIFRAVCSSNKLALTAYVIVMGALIGSHADKIIHF